MSRPFACRLFDGMRCCVRASQEPVSLYRCDSVSNESVSWVGSSELLLFLLRSAVHLTEFGWFIRLFYELPNRAGSIGRFVRLLRMFAFRCACMRPSSKIALLMMRPGFAQLQFAPGGPSSSSSNLHQVAPSSSSSNSTLQELALKSCNSTFRTWYKFNSQQQ